MSQQRSARHVRPQSSPHRMMMKAQDEAFAKQLHEVELVSQNMTAARVADHGRRCAGRHMAGSSRRPGTARVRSATSWFGKNSSSQRSCCRCKGCTPSCCKRCDVSVSVHACIRPFVLRHDISGMQPFYPSCRWLPCRM